MRSAPSVRWGFSPLDEELQLLPGHLTPSLQESLVRLGTWLPFSRVGKELHFFTHVTVSEPTARRATQVAGAAYVGVQTDEVERIERTLPTPPAGPAVQLLSVDGAMVPLVHQEWAEVKTLVVGTVNPPVLDVKRDEAVVHCTDLSYFSRLADAETFGRLALVETHRRGTETAKHVCAVTDGAEWEQGFVDLHRRDAIRILDFSHAAGYVADAGTAVLGEDTPPFQDWLTDSLHELKHGHPETVLNLLRDMHAEALAGGATAATVKVLQTSASYLEKRREHIAYARFQALGYPIGSGTVESANKLVVEARLKGAGMHWARSHVDPMLALRNIACSDRWDEAWPQITRRLRQQACVARVERRHKRQAKKLAVAESLATLPSPTASVGSAQPVAAASPSETPWSIPSNPPEFSASVQPAQSCAVKKEPYRRGADHPWRHSPIGRARFKPPRGAGDAKL